MMHMFLLFTGSKCIRSESTLPVMLPNSDPPTPTRMAGTHSEFEFEDRGEQRGDLIHFYNTVSYRWMLLYLSLYYK